MSVERIPCRNPDCKHTILPATAKANDGLCAPCIGRIRQAEREEFIRKNRRTVNLYENVTDPVEMICLMLKPRNYDPLIEFIPPPEKLGCVVQKLNHADQERLVEIAIDAIKLGNEDLSDDIAKSLATLTDANLDSILNCWLDKAHLWPSVAFRNADPSVRDRIIRMVELENTNLNHALSALAWIGDEKVQQYFAKWEQESYRWVKSLYVGPSKYAHLGGWELVASSRRNLYYNQCYGLEKIDDVNTETDVECITEQDNTCPWCGTNLIHLIEIPSGRPELQFLEYSAEILPVLTCELCTCYSGHIFAQVGMNGKAILHKSNDISSQEMGPKFVWERGPWKGVKAKLTPRRPMQSVDWCMEFPATQIGGMPCWVQDTAYPKCPDCSRLMRFLAQIDNNEFKGHEGIYYAFWCSDCRITGTTYQQT